MRFGPAATLGVLLGLALILPACGESGTAASSATETTKRTERAANPQPARAGRAAAKVPPAKQCIRALGDFLDSIESLGNSLAVGLDYENYLGAVNHVRATYAGVDAERLGIVCLTRVAAPAEQALNTYIVAANDWGECLAAASCATGSIEAELQREWEEASDLLSKARGGLRALA